MPTNNLQDLYFELLKKNTPIFDLQCVQITEEGHTCPIIKLSELSGGIWKDFRIVLLIEDKKIELNWSPKLAQLFACDVVEHALFDSADYFPDDIKKSALNALSVAKRFANGDADTRELENTTESIKTIARHNAKRQSGFLLWSVYFALKNEPSYSCHYAANYVAYLNAEEVIEEKWKQEKEWQAFWLSLYLFDLLPV